MTIKLSSAKVERLLRLYLLGFSQVEISEKLGINQATVSLYVNSFNDMVENDGIESAAEEYKIMDIIKELHSLGAELKQEHLSVEDAKKGLKVAVVMEECDVPQKMYKDVVDACRKMAKEGFLDAAVELNKLEINTGKKYKELMAEALSASTKFDNLTTKIQGMEKEIEKEETKLSDIQKKRAESEIQQKEFMEKLGVDFNRLKKIENLAIYMKEGAISDNEIEVYMQRQKYFNKSGINMDMFSKIIDAIKVHAATDGGKKLWEKLAQYNNIDEAVTALEKKEQMLIISTGDLDAKMELKGKIEVDLKQLQSQKGNLESSVMKLIDKQSLQKKKVEQLTHEENSLQENLDLIQSGLSEKQLLSAKYDKEITMKQQAISDLNELESKRALLIKEISELEMSAKEKALHFNVVEALEGYIQSTATEKVEQFINAIPQLLKDSAGKYKPEFLRAYVFKNITGGTLNVLKCSSCNAKFCVDKPADTFGYKCPVCGSSFGINVDQDEINILNSAIAKTK